MEAQNARLKILKRWYNNQKSSEEAHVLMGKALIGAGLKHIPWKVWNYPPVKKNSERLSNIRGKFSKKRTRTALQNMIKTQEGHKVRSRTFAEEQIHLSKSSIAGSIPRSPLSKEGKACIKH